MKLYQAQKIKEAILNANRGGQSLHIYKALPNLFPKAPRVFKQASIWGHLFDQNKERLIETAVALGVNRIFIHSENTENQHIDLCGRPLRKAIENTIEE